MRYHGYASCVEASCPVLDDCNMGINRAMWHIALLIPMLQSSRTGAALGKFWQHRFETSPRSVPLHSWWRHQMETFSALLAICAGNSPVPTRWPVTRSFDVFFDLRLNKRLSKQSWGWWFETLSCPLWRHCNGFHGKRTFHVMLTYFGLSIWYQAITWTCPDFLSISHSGTKLQWKS